MTGLCNILAIVIQTSCIVISNSAAESGSRSSEPTQGSSTQVLNNKTNIKFIDVIDDIKNAYKYLNAWDSRTKFHADFQNSISKKYLDCDMNDFNQWYKNQAQYSKKLVSLPIPAGARLFRTVGPRTLEIKESEFSEWQLIHKFNSTKKIKKVTPNNDGSIVAVGLGNENSESYAYRFFNYHGVRVDSLMGVNNVIWYDSVTVYYTNKTSHEDRIFYTICSHTVGTKQSNDKCYNKLKYHVHFIPTSMWFSVHKESLYVQTNTSYVVQIVDYNNYNSNNTEIIYHGRKGEYQLLQYKNDYEIYLKSVGGVTDILEKSQPFDIPIKDRSTISRVIYRVPPMYTKLHAVAAGGDKILLNLYKDGVSVLKLISSTTGKEVRNVHLSQGCLVTELTGHVNSDKAYFTCVSIFDPPKYFEVNVGDLTYTVQVYDNLMWELDLLWYKYEVKEYKASNETTIRMTTIAKAKSLNEEPRPVYLLVNSVNGYVPNYKNWAFYKYLVNKLNCIIAVLHYGGSGDEGLEWSTSGSDSNISKRIGDINAAVKYLIDSYHTESRLIMVESKDEASTHLAAAINQHPDMVGAVIFENGIFDILEVQSNKESRDYGVTSEHSINVKISPYQNVNSSNGEYPTMLVQTSKAEDKIKLAATKYVFKLESWLSEHNNYLRTYGVDDSEMASDLDKICFIKKHINKKNDDELPKNTKIIKLIADPPTPFDDY